MNQLEQLISQLNSPGVLGLNRVLILR
uniref:Uncharacterized protein n=1 Tax=Anguilla anguilla TaxID=7936 RepID=A0A0E9V5K0_ANGAN